ncbi:C40 family peptidase [uncultured Flavobacterium sp.]|uniref:C40 family peptidase n=1 Tax=uncultured Flavobacterium sp. TaxID=165435 RepID=UPI0030EB1540|tara:strand:- start:18169 stop:18759 length:591 start_codon:yes stop_codon:yes gene_type:complete
MLKTKNIFLLFFSLLLLSCGSQKKSSFFNEDTVYQEPAGNVSDYVIYEPLPEEDKVYFANKIGVEKEEILDGKLYKFLKEWEGTNYVYGGETKSGIDCSALMQRLFNKVYNYNLPRTAAEMGFDKNIEQFKSRKHLREGDLVFFRITDEKIISHVGIYLKNNKFFNANLSGGASISDLNSPYWRKFYVVSGRLKKP